MKRLRNQLVSDDSAESETETSTDRSKLVSVKKSRNHRSRDEATNEETVETEGGFAKIVPLNIGPQSSVGTDDYAISKSMGFARNFSSESESVESESSEREGETEYVDDTDYDHDVGVGELKSREVVAQNLQSIVTTCAYYEKDQGGQSVAFECMAFKSASDSTSIYETVKETENALDAMVLNINQINDLPQREINTDFYTKLLPIFVKTHLLLVDIIAIPAEFTPTVIKSQGFYRFFTFENLRLFNLDNATLLLDHRYKKTGGRYVDFIMKVVGRPISKALAAFPKVLTSDTNVFAGSTEVSVPTRHFVRSYILRPNFSLLKMAISKNAHVIEHQFSEGVPANFWWNVIDAGIPKMGDFNLKLYEALQDRPITLDFLFLLGNVDASDNKINLVKGQAKWEPANILDPPERAAVTIHMMLCFGFRILSFGMLCEYPKDEIDVWIKGMDDNGDKEHRLAYASKRRRQMNTFRYKDTSVSRIKKHAVMRMVYTLESTESINNFFRILDTHELAMKNRVVRSRLFYKKSIKWDVVGGSYVYPNHSMYMVVGSCNMLYSSREMSVCTASLSESMLQKLDDKPRRDFDQRKKPPTIKPTKLPTSEHKPVKGRAGITGCTQMTNENRPKTSGSHATLKRPSSNEQIAEPQKKRGRLPSGTNSSVKTIRSKRANPLTLSPAPISSLPLTRGETFMHDK